MASDKAAYQLVLGYLTKMNRPYSVIDIVTNLGSKEANKAAVVRVLSRLTSEKKVVEKTYGKQKIYYINQEKFEVVANEDLKQLDSEITNFTTTYKEIQAMAVIAERDVAILSRTPTTIDAKAELIEIEAEIPKLERYLDTLRSNPSAERVDPEEKARLQSLNQRYSFAWRKRKLMATDMLDAIAENYPKPKKVLMEELSIETDEDKN